jgi:hypothetical protein
VVLWPAWPEGLSASAVRAHLARQRGVLAASVARISDGPPQQRAGGSSEGEGERRRAVGRCCVAYLRSEMRALDAVARALG